MHPRIAEAFDALDRARQDLADTVGAIPDADRTRRPASGGWSAAQVLAHLVAVEGRLTALIASIVKTARAAGLPAETDESPVAPTVDAARLLDREKKLTAGEAVQPPDEVDFAEAWSDLQARRERLKSTILAADGLALGQVVATNPVLGPINVYQWLYFIAGHEARHREQIRAIGF